MVTKFFKEYAGNKAAFVAAGHETTYFNNIVLIKDSANSGVGSCIYARGSYFGNFAELIAALAYVKGIKVGTDSYNAAQGGGYVEFAAANPSTVTLAVADGKVTIGLTPAFVQSVNTVIEEVATIKGDYLKAADRTALEVLILSAKTEAINAVVGNATSDTKDSKTIEGVRKYVDAKTSGIASEGVVSELSGRVGVIEADYLKAADKTELQGSINTEKGRVDAIVTDYLKAADKETLQGAINTEKGRVDAIVADYLKAADKTELADRITNEAPVTMAEAAGTGDILKTYTFTQNGKEIGKINLAKELVVTGGNIVEIEGVKNLQLTIANQENPVNIPVSELVDAYTGSEFVTISDANVISIDKAGIIAGLATDANAQGYANAAKEAAIADANGKLASKADKTDLNNYYTKENTYSKTEVDGKFTTELAPYAKTSDVNGELAKKADKTALNDYYKKTETYSQEEVNNLLSGKENAGVAYTKAETEGLLAAKANSTDVYTKAEVEAMFAWETIA